MLNIIISLHLQNDFIFLSQAVEFITQWLYNVGQINSLSLGFLIYKMEW